MQRAKYLIIALLALSYLTGVTSTFAQHKLPQRLIKESQEFLEDQIIPADKEFLNRLSASFISLAKINAETFNLLKATFPAGNKYYKKISKAIKLAAKEADRKLSGPKKPLGILDSFRQSFLPKSAEAAKNLHSLIIDYKICEKIENYVGEEVKNDVFAEGNYLYYQRCIESFENAYGENFTEIIPRNISLYNYLAELARQHKIEDLKNMLPPSVKRLQTAERLIQLRVINKVALTNRSWSKQLILNGLNIFLQQLELNKNFNFATAKVLEQIPTPKPALLPDFTVPSIAIVLPPKLKKGSMVKVIAEIKNEGNLTAERSKALMIFPNGAKRGRLVARLLPQQKVKVIWRYKVRRSGEHEFNVIANYDGKSWETNPNNNSTIRTLVIPRCD